MLYDVHAHLEFDELYGISLNQLVDEALKRNMKGILAAGIDLKSNEFVLKVARTYPDLIIPGFGLHPENIVKNPLESEKCFEFILNNIESAKALSEIGLDFGYPELNLQKNYFERFIELSITHSLPMVIHTRKAESKVIEILESYRDLKKNHVVLHCFSGKKSLVKRGIENGWFFSIPPNVVRSTHFQMIILMTPIEQLLTETDSPFLAPFPDEVNYPWNVSYSVKKIAEIKGMDELEVEKIIEGNFKRLLA
ncbi:MAG: TatD DNase family protein [Candidatus Woesearchaeota archaeon]|nr:TatD DNase family protein [Candidatus Woesearchaeota archaeon]